MVGLLSVVRLTWVFHVTSTGTVARCNVLEVAPVQFSSFRAPYDFNNGFRTSDLVQDVNGVRGVDLVLHVNRHGICQIVDGLHGPLRANHTRDPCRNQVRVEMRGVHQVRFVGRPYFLVRFFRFSNREGIVAICMEGRVPLLYLSKCRPSEVPLVNDSLGDHFVVNFYRVSIIACVVGC